MPVMGFWLVLLLTDQNLHKALNQVQYLQPQRMLYTSSLFTLGHDGRIDSSKHPESDSVYSYMSTRFLISDQPDYTAKRTSNLDSRRQIWKRRKGAGSWGDAGAGTRAAPAGSGRAENIHDEHLPTYLSAYLRGPAFHHTMLRMIGLHG